MCRGNEPCTSQHVGRDAFSSGAGASQSIASSRTGFGKFCQSNGRSGTKRGQPGSGSKSQVSLRFADKTCSASPERGTPARRFPCAGAAPSEREFRRFAGVRMVLFLAEVRRSQAHHSGGRGCPFYCSQSRWPARGKLHANCVVIIRLLTRGEELGRIQVDSAVLSLAFAGDPMTLQVADRTGKVTSWSTTGRPLATVMNVGKNLEVAYLTKAGELLVALAEGTDDLTVHLCRNGSTMYWGSIALQVGLERQVPLIAMNNESNRLASASGDTVMVINAASPDDPQSHRLTEESTRRVGCISISDDGQVLAAAETTDFENSMPRRNELELTKGFRIKAWDLSDGHELCSFIGHMLSINLIAISHDRTRLATASRDETIKDLELGKSGGPDCDISRSDFFHRLGVWSGWEACSGG